MRVVPLRLMPGDDLRQGLELWIREQREQAGWLISGIGSLSVVQLRLAGQQVTTTIRGDLEIISMAGSLSTDGVHLHLAIADHNGAVIGGHLCHGSKVRTTAELMLGLLDSYQFLRKPDAATGYAELVVVPSNRLSDA